MYGDTEELEDTRIRNYDSLNIKTTQSILPDPPSLTQHVRRANLQCYYWKSCLEPIIEKIEPTTSDWLRNSDNMLEPLWFEGPQFPETLQGLQGLSSDTSDMSNFSDSADEYSTYESERFGSESDSDDADI